MGECTYTGRTFSPDYWYVAFVKRNRTHWIDWLLPAGFRHVFAMGYVIETGYWLVYDVRLDATNIDVLEGQALDQLLAWCWQEGIVLRADCVPRSPQKHLRFGFWCVPAIKHLLGLKSCALTPRALYRHLVKIGCERIMPQYEEISHGVHETGCAEGKQIVTGGA